MKKINLFFVLGILFSLLGCRNENIYSDARNPNLTGEFTFKQVYRKDIPQIINFLTERTGDLKVPLKTNNALGKETVFGEIYTDYIVESTNENGETYYTFSVIPYTGGDESKTYNLSVKSDGSTAESAKIIVYYPTEDWLLNGNGNFSVFSGTAYTYSLDGDIESSVEYHKGMADLCNPDPCPDCQGPSNPPGNGGGTSGGGGGVGGNPPTGTGGPVAYPPYTPSSPTPGQSGTTGGGQLCYWTCIYNDEGECYKMECITVVSAPRLVNPCGGGGVVVVSQTNPCEKIKAQNTNVNYKAKVDELKGKVGLKKETGYSESKTGSFTSLNPANSTDASDALKLSINADTKGYIHTHLNDYGDGTTDDNGNPKIRQPIRMFSPADVNALMELASLANGKYENLYGTMISGSGNYTIKFTGTAADIKTGFDTDAWRDSFITYKKKNDGWTLEKLFLNFLKNEMKVNGIELYKIKNDGTVQKKTLNSNNKVESTDCP